MDMLYTRGKAAEIIEQAQSYKQERINQAIGDAERFVKMATDNRLPALALPETDFEK